MFHGSITALITPFTEGAVDEKALEALVEHQIAQGSHGLVVCGTTGESPTLSHDEHNHIVGRVVEIVKGRVPVIAGTGSNATTEAIQSTRYATEAGADGALLVTPYYNKPTQEGLYAHFKAIHDVTDIPLIIYNIPGRCVVDMGVETMARLAALPRYIGVKDATGDLDRVAATRAACGEDFLQFSGNDDTALDFLERGGHGCISVTSNVAPSLCAQMHEAWEAGAHETARAINERLMPLHRALFVETSPQAAKYGCARLGLCTDEMRLPLLPASPAARAAVDDALAQTGLLLDGAPAILRAHG
ncbi:MAG: 4-hydroxy-tetrahydrodipicolinate synthase [Alphaproteobacteria bacterium]|nr:4-hydroxy-tetrahydrodipicolinate synthase [Alphaproteobacteria bacterium]